MVTETNTQGKTGVTKRESSKTSRPRATTGQVRQSPERGALATLVMTAYRLPVTRSLPPTAEFWVQYVSRSDPYDHPVVALALHAVYLERPGRTLGLVSPHLLACVTLAALLARVARTSLSTHG